MRLAKELLPYNCSICPLVKTPLDRSFIIHTAEHIHIANFMQIHLVSSFRDISPHSPSASAASRRTIKRTSIGTKKKMLALLLTKLSREQKLGVPIKRGEAAKHFFTKFGSVKVLIDS